LTLDEWAAWYDSWLLHLRAKGRRPSTLEFYRRELLRFGEHVGVPPQAVTRAHVEGWVLAQVDAGLAPHTVNNRLICIKSFYSWLADEGEIPASPAARVSSPPHRGPDPAVLSDAEHERLLDLVPHGSTDPLIRRNRAILLTLNSSGVRAAELISMTDTGLDLQGRRVAVQAKGGGWRDVPIDDAAAAAIDRYRRSRTLLRGERLWRGYRGDLTTKGLAGVLRVLGERAGVDLHAHRYRHRFAHTWQDKGGSEAGLMTAAGWSSVVMPRRYGRALSVERMLDEHARLFRG
jgi:site-specific recombinase XerD